MHKEDSIIKHCVDCGLPMQIKLNTIRRQKKDSRCHSCRAALVSKNISEKVKSLWQTNDYRERVKIGRVCSLVNESERRQKISKSLKAHFSKPNTREILSVSVSMAMRKKWQDPVWRQRIVDSQRRTAAEFWGFDAKKFKIGLDKAIDRIEIEDS